MLASRYKRRPNPVSEPHDGIYRTGAAETPNRCKAPTPTTLPLTANGVTPSAERGNPAGGKPNSRGTASVVPSARATTLGVGSGQGGDVARGEVFIDLTLEIEDTVGMEPEGDDCVVQAAARPVERSEVEANVGPLGEEGNHVGGEDEVCCMYSLLGVVTHKGDITGERSVASQLVVFRNVACLQ